jgi:O-antigen/teichoic acid export membrane protein
MIRSFLKDSAIYVIPSIVSRGMSLFLVPLYTRVLTPDDYGALDLLIMFAGIVNLTVSLEISQAVARFYSDESDPNKKIEYSSSGFWFTLLSYFLFVVICFCFSKNISTLVMGRKGLELPFQIGLVYIFFNGLMYFVQNQLRWELRSKAYSLLSLIFSLSTAVASIWLAYFLNYGLEGLLVGMVIGSLLTFSMGCWLLRNSIRLKISRHALYSMLFFSAPLVPAGIAIWISGYVDRIMINYFLTLEEVGLYGIGFRLASIGSIVMVGFQAALTPLVYTYHSKPDTPFQLSRIFRLFLAFCILFFLGINLFVHDILALFTQPAFYNAYKVIIYLIPSILLGQMYIFAPGIFLAKKTSYVLWINIFGALVNALLNYILIPLMGFSGAGLATMLGQGLVFLIYMILSQKYYSVPHNWINIGLVIVLSTGLMILVKSYYSSGWWYYLLCFLSIIFTMWSFVFLGLIKNDEVILVRKMIKDKVNLVFN